MKATFLEADVPLTKTFTMKDGQLTKIGHPRIIDYTSHEVEYNNIEELHQALLTHSSKGHCFLKGNVSRPLVKESRAGTTNPAQPTHVLLLDLDGVKGVDTIEEFLALIGFSSVDYIVQYSSSMGILPERGLSAHVFMLLDREQQPAVLKQYLMKWNLTVPQLKAALGLTSTNNALRWSLDVTTCQNDKLIYIAPPIVKNGVKDNFEGERIQLVKGKARFVTLPTPMPLPETNREMQETQLNELRSALGLKKRPKDQFKSQGPVEFLVRPDIAVVTGVKVEKAFTYLNLNGGDSWAYWHPTDNPEFIRNFKGEPVYRTADLVPEYWAQVRHTRAEVKPDESGVIYLAFRDFKTAQYYNGTYDSRSKYLNLAPATGKQQLVDYLINHGRPVPDSIPDWDVVFDPHLDEACIVDQRKVNLFKPTPFMLVKPRKGAQMPPTIRRLMLHVLGDDEEMLDHQNNILACMLQFRDRCGTCTIMHGVPGTGKGIFLSRILRPLFGVDNVATKRMREINSQFNGYMEKALVMWVDEAEQSDFKDQGIVNADIKNFITEPRISIRNMYTMPREVPNHMTWFMASNKGHIIQIDPDDRRFNVCQYQSKRLEITEADLVKIEDELMDYAVFLMSYEANKDRARKPLNNAAKSKMIQLNRTAIDTATDAINRGDLQFFRDLMPQDGVESLPRFEQDRAKSFIELVERLDRDRPPALLREELFILLDFAVGDMPTTPIKFSSYLKHHRITIDTVWRDGKAVRGTKVKWTDSKKPGSV